LSEQKFFKREELIGKIVVNTNAVKLGAVKDVAYDTSGRTALIISSPQGVEKIYPMDEAVAIKDVVLLDENKTGPRVLRTSVSETQGVSHGPAPKLVDSPRAWSPTPPGPGLTMTMKTCQWCKRENRVQSKFCVHCGKPL